MSERRYCKSCKRETLHDFKRITEKEQPKQTPSLTDCVLSGFSVFFLGKDWIAEPSVRNLYSCQVCDKSSKI